MPPTFLPVASRCLRSAGLSPTQSWRTQRTQGGSHGASHRSYYSMFSSVPLQVSTQTSAGEAAVGSLCFDGWGWISSADRTEVFFQEWLLSLPVFLALSREVVKPFFGALLQRISNSPRASSSAQRQHSSLMHSASGHMFRDPFSNYFGFPLLSMANFKCVLQP